MPRYEPNSRFSDCWSSVGDTTFFHIDGVCYWKKKPVCEFAGTPGQMEQLELHRRALAAWKTLEHDVQLQWNTFGASAPSHKPPFDGSTHITGHNLFVSAYHGFTQLGDEHVPEPAPWEEFPLLHLKFSSAVAVGDSDLQMTFRASLPECSDPTRYRVVAKLLITEPGHTRTGGFYRTFLALSNCPSADADVRFIIPDFRNLWPVTGPSYQVHCRYLLIDTQNGYRNIFRKTSFLMNLG
jgi:hypothetical protein